MAESQKALRCTAELEEQATAIILRSQKYKDWNPALREVSQRLVAGHPNSVAYTGQFLLPGPSADGGGVGVKGSSMDTPLEEALGVMVDTFHKYSGKEGDKYKLNKAEMKTLLQNELPTFVKGKINEAALENLMKSLDENGDEDLDFQEYAVFVVIAASLCHEFFLECADETNRKI